MEAEAVDVPEEDVTEETSNENDGEPGKQLAPVAPVATGVVAQSELSAEQIEEMVDKVRDIASRVMQPDVDYGVIAQGMKPTLLKPGAEKLCLTFRLATRFKRTKHRDGMHLTVESECELYHIPTGLFVGSAGSECSTYESRYRWRTAKRTCPSCGADQINRSKFLRESETEPGWYCHAKFGGCGAQFAYNDPAILDQQIGRVENEDLADVWNTIVKIADKRALVAAVLLVTGASAVYTQDLEDTADGEVATPFAGGEAVPQPKPKREAAKPEVRRQESGTKIRHEHWGDLLQQIDEDAGFERGIALKVFKVVAASEYGVTLERPSDLGEKRQEALNRMNAVWQAVAARRDQMPPLTAGEYIDLAFTNFPGFKEKNEALREELSKLVRFREAERDEKPPREPEGAAEAVAAAAKDVAEGSGQEPLTQGEEKALEHAQEEAAVEQSGENPFE